MIWARMLAYVTRIVNQELLLRNAESPRLLTMSCFSCTWEVGGIPCLAMRL
jgi:hypothetical protein